MKTATQPFNDERGHGLSEERILRLWETHVGEPTSSRPLTDSDKVNFARSVLYASTEPSRPVAIYRLTEYERWLNRHRGMPVPTISEAVAADVEKDAARYRLIRQDADIRDGKPFIARFNAGAFSQWTGIHADMQIDAVLFQKDKS